MLNIDGNNNIINELKENTYIKEWTERLKKEGKI